MKKNRYLYALVFLLCLPLLSRAADVELLNWWTSKGEARSMQLLINRVESGGDHWLDVAVEGGGGRSAIATLRSRALAGNPPTAAQLKGKELMEWAELGFLADLSPTAKKEHWDALFPPVVQKNIKYQGHYVAVPAAIHRVNWLWINAKLYRKLKLPIPTTWQQLLNNAEQLKRQGITPLAMGNQPWQIAALFEAITLGSGGLDFYRQAIINLDPHALQGPTMIKVLQLFHRFHSFIPSSNAELSWDQATQMVIKGEAAMQLMGDWAKGEITAANQIPGRDILCVTPPGTDHIFDYNIDSIALFKHNPSKTEKSQQRLLNIITNPDFQMKFSALKGSIPAIKGVDPKQFDVCAYRSFLDFTASEKNATLVPSMTERMATDMVVRSAIMDIVSGYFNDPKGDASKTAQRLARVINTHKRSPQ